MLPIIHWVHPKHPSIHIISFDGVTLSLCCGWPAMRIDYPGATLKAVIKEAMKREPNGFVYPSSDFGWAWFTLKHRVKAVLATWENPLKPRISGPYIVI